MLRSKSEAGNVFILIMLGVFLFGALLYAFSRSARQGTGNLTKQQAKIATQEILNYARLVEGAVDRVRRNGCSETEISFDNAVVSGYSHPKSPSDKSCHIFEDEGGKVDYVAPPTNWLDNDPSTDPIHGDTTFVGISSVQNLLSDKSDLIFFVPHVKENLCIEINNTLNLSNATSEDDTGMITDTKFTGTFDAAPPAAAVIGDSGSSSTINLEESGCIYESSNCNGSACYNFYHVLLAR